MMKPERKYLHLVDSDQLGYATGIISTREAMTQVLNELDAIDVHIKRVAVFPVDAEHKKTIRMLTQINALSLQSKGLEQAQSLAELLEGCLH